ncbi:MAG: hypothetical protein ACLFS6_06695 [Methanomassiliicoccales archaeon]
MSQDEVTRKIEELRGEFGRLLDDDELMKLALDELSESIINRKSVSEVRDRETVTLQVDVIKVYDTKEFTKRDGGTGLVRDILVEDDTGSCMLVLWDMDALIPEYLEIDEKIGLNLVNCYARSTDFGLTVTRGRIGKIEKTSMDNR